MAETEAAQRGWRERCFSEQLEGCSTIRQLRKNKFFKIVYKESSPPFETDKVPLILIHGNPGGG